MTSNRPYRQALSVQEVISYLHEKSGILFDPTSVKALDSILARSTDPEHSTHPAVL